MRGGGRKEPMLCRAFDTFYCTEIYTFPVSRTTNKVCSVLTQALIKRVHCRLKIPEIGYFETRGHLPGCLAGEHEVGVENQEHAGDYAPYKYHQQTGEGQ